MAFLIPGDLCDAEIFIYLGIAQVAWDQEGHDLAPAIGQDLIPAGKPCEHDMAIGRVVALANEAQAVTVVAAV
jgi:hypothetical protein